jgi:uncharacterized membrane protein
MASLNQRVRETAGRMPENSAQWTFLIGGGSLVVYGLTRRSLGGAALAFLGGDLIYRALTGRHLISGLNAPATGQARDLQAGIKVSETVIIRKPAADLYAFWRNFENLPSLMTHVQSVTPLDDRRSRWVVKGPLGTRLEWDAEIVRDFENELITWQSLENADVIHAGSVSFKPRGDGNATEVKVILRYDPPGGMVGKAVAALLGENPSRQVRQDLQRFKKTMEASALADAESEES